MNAPTLADRYAQARLYAQQVRARRAMGDRYAHYQPNSETNSRRLVSEKLEESSLA
jgi:hypothetical protein